MGVMRADGGGLEKAKEGDAGVGEAEQEQEEEKRHPCQHGTVNNKSGIRWTECSH